MPIWVVRAGKNGEDENTALDRSLVLIGWQQTPDLSPIDTPERMRALCEEVDPDAPKGRISNHVGQLWSFRERIKQGDIVALPLRTRSAVALGRINGPYEYLDVDGQRRHTRSVEWLRTDAQRSDFGQDLLHSMGAFLTVFGFDRNNAEKRVRAIVNGGRDPNLIGATTPSDLPEVISAVEGETEFDIAEYARDLIRRAIGARFGGHELTALVTALLKAQGYQTYMAPPGPDGGVDILAGNGAMGFDPPRICVQVKSGGLPVDVSVLRELQGVMKNFGAERGLLVSWGGFKESVYREARTLFFEIRLWDSELLLRSLLEHYSRLPEEIQAELPLKQIWTLVPEE